MFRSKNMQYKRERDVDEASIVDMNNVEDVGPLVHKSSSSEQIDIDVEIYLEEL